MMILRGIVHLLHAAVFAPILTFALGIIVLLIVPEPVSVWIVAIICLVFFVALLTDPTKKAW